MLFLKEKYLLIDPDKPTIFLSKMPEWVDDIGYKYKVKENQIVYSRKEPSLSYRITSSIIISIAIGFLVFLYVDMFHKIMDFGDAILYIMSFICFVFPLILLAINLIQNPDRIFVFDRIKGTLTMPSNWLMWNNKTVTIPLEEVRYMIRLVAGPFGGATIKVFFPQYKNPSHFLKLTYGAHGMVEVRQFNTFYLRSEYSVINWFMDKNRPLPPGALFDEYREEDYLRRKAEGFPPPLYESYVDTPEWEGAITKYKDKEAKIRNRTIYKGSGKPGIPRGAF